jgi:hypothetical protein
VILGFIASLAIVVQDHTSIRAEPRASAAELTALWQGDVVEIRGERVGYLKIYNYRRERGGYLKAEAVRPVEFSEAAAPDLLAVLRFLRDSPGSEALGISYGAAYLKAVPARALTAEPFDAIARMAERLADQDSGGARLANVAAHLEVVEQFGVHMRSFERNGRMRVCYDGELYRRVLNQAGASAAERARAALGLTRPDCIDPDLGSIERASLDQERGQLLDTIDERPLDPTAKAQVHARRAGVWAAIAFEKARHLEAPAEAAQRALSEMLSVRASDLGEDHRSEFQDAALRVSASRWAAAFPAAPLTPFVLDAAPGDPGQTCLTLEERQPHRTAMLLRRCTYGVVWMASARMIPQAPALVLAVQPLEGWRELWVFHRKSGAWAIDVISPGAEDPEQGYVEFAGFAPELKRLLIARECKDHGQYRRRFEELRIDDLALVRQASTPDLLRDFGRWQDAAWRRDTLALR